MNRNETLSIAYEWLEVYRKRGKAFTFAGFARETRINYEWMREQHALYSELGKLRLELDDSRTTIAIRKAFKANPNATDEQIAAFAKCGANTVKRYRRLMGIAEPKNNYVRSPLQEAQQEPIDKDRVSRCLAAVLAHIRDYGRRLEKQQIAMICGCRNPSDAVVQAVIDRLKRNPDVHVEETTYSNTTRLVVSWKQQEVAA